MKVIRAESAGFCFGVSRALKTLDKEIQKPKAGNRLATLGPIIHNPLVMADYADQGVLCFEDISEAKKNDTIIIRAHGVPRKTEKLLEETGARIVDATCPKVKKAQISIEKESKEGKTLLLLGEEKHPEVQGLISYSQKTFVFSELADLKKYPLDPDGEYFLAAQTTQERSLFKEVEKYLKTKLQKLKSLHTICEATKRRQNEVIELAKKVEAMVVVGGLNSGNTTRLADVARAQKIPAFHVENPLDLDTDKLKNFKCIGLTAGASTPDKHIEQMERILLEI